MWARIDGGVVREITSIDPAGRFHPSLIWLPCPPEVRDGWIHDGQGFAPPAPIAPPPPDLGDYSRAVEAHIEAAARSIDPATGRERYASAVSCVSYVGDPNAQWDAEARAFRQWRSDVWTAVFAALGAWEAGGEAPTIEGLIAGLPDMDWPAAN